MEDTPEVYHYSIAEAAELLGCKESHLLQFAAFSGLPVHVFITDALVDKDGNQKGSFSNYFQLAQMHVRALIANGSIKINPVLLMEATPVQEGLGVNYADFVLHHLPLENGLRTYAVFPETQEITISANRVVVLAKHLTDFQNRNAGKPSAVPEKASSEIDPVAAHQTVSKEDKSEQEPLVNWKMRIQAEATAMWRRGRTHGANPTKHSIMDDLARWCRDKNVKTKTGINPDATYIARHVLNKWEPPND